MEQLETSPFELKKEADKYRKESNFGEAVDLYFKLWEYEKNEWNGYFLAQCYRKVQRYTDARTLHATMEQLFPSFKPIQQEELWLDYSEKVTDWENPDLLEDAEKLIAKVNQYDKYTGTLYVKTVLKVVRYLCHNGQHVSAFNWLIRLDQSVISNTVFKFDGKTYPADRKTYFMWFAFLLIRLNYHQTYIEKCLSYLGYKGNKLIEFKEYIISDISPWEHVFGPKLARYIKQFQEEIHLRSVAIPKVIFKEDNIILISDLSHYLFCPASYVINKTFIIDANTSWEKDEWVSEKKLFIDRHKIFKQTKNLNDAFKDTDIKPDQELINTIRYVFNSTIRVNNVTNPKPTIYSNKDNMIKGAPDYIMEDVNGRLYAITEKFSSIFSADSKAPFESDLIKHHAYLHELENLKIAFGLMITWYWQYVDITTEKGPKKKVKVVSCRITKVDRTDSGRYKLQRAIDGLKSLKLNKSLKVDGDKISYPNKCMSCSVVTYCSHKTGKYDQVALPYILTRLSEGEDPNKKLFGKMVSEDQEQEDVFI
jgi:tetratricopeptide (TPR) repeat protein